MVFIQQKAGDNSIMTYDYPINVELIERLNNEYRQEAIDKGAKK